MLTYNTHLRPILLPEYGRVVQNMVDYCVTIEDRDERNRCAAAIIATMRTLRTETQGNDEEEEHRLWDHLALMSNFTLDIDWPYEPIRPDSIPEHPDPVPPIGSGVTQGIRRYGRNLEDLIAVAASMQPGDDRDALVELVANQMKKSMIAFDPDGDIYDARIFADLREMTGGAIDIDPATMPLHNYTDVPTPGKKKKKK